MVAVLSNIAIALGVLTSYAAATTYANFCDDGDCALNCGIAVSVDNPGCLAESGRQSVKFHDVNIQQVSLVFSPDSACSCQSYCIPSILKAPAPYSAPGCLALTGPPTNSFRFIGGGSCDDNNC